MGRFTTYTGDQTGNWHQETWMFHQQTTMRVSKCLETEVLTSKTGTEAAIEWGYLVETRIAIYWTNVCMQNCSLEKQGFLLQLTSERKWTCITFHPFRVSATPLTIFFFEVAWLKLEIFRLSSLSNKKSLQRVAQFCSISAVALYSPVNMATGKSHIFYFSRQMI